MSNVETSEVCDFLPLQVGANFEPLVAKKVIVVRVRATRSAD
jgi:hypothetical protein